MGSPNTERNHATHTAHQSIHLSHTQIMHTGLQNRPAPCPCDIPVLMCFLIAVINTGTKSTMGGRRVLQLMSGQSPPLQEARAGTPGLLEAGTEAETTEDGLPACPSVSLSAAFLIPSRPACPKTQQPTVAKSSRTNHGSEKASQPYLQAHSSDRATFSSEVLLPR